MMTNDHEHQHEREPGRAIVARFESPAEARTAVGALHKAHYTHTWLGTTSVATTGGGNETITVESGSGFFSETHSLVDALVSHGVIGATAREIERTLEAGDALITVDPKDRDVLGAISLIEQYGGHIAGHHVGADTDLWLPPSRPRTGLTASGDAAVTYGAHDAFYRRS